MATRIQQTVLTSNALVATSPKIFVHVEKVLVLHRKGDIAIIYEKWKESLLLHIYWFDFYVFLLCLFCIPVREIKVTAFKNF